MGNLSPCSILVLKFLQKNPSIFFGKYAICFLVHIKSTEIEFCLFEISRFHNIVISNEGVMFEGEF